MDNNTIAIIGSLLGICVAGITVVKFWMSFATRIADATAIGKSALDIAQEAKKDAHEASEKIAIQSAAFGLYREQIAREYIHREVMREVEERLTAAIERLGDRLDRVLVLGSGGH